MNALHGVHDGRRGNAEGFGERVDVLDDVGAHLGLGALGALEEDELAQVTKSFHGGSPCCRRWVEGGGRSEAEPRFDHPDYTALEERQRARLAALRARRSQPDVERALAAVGAAARSDHNLLPPIVDAVRALATLGEVSDTLRGAWGTYDAGRPTG